MPETITISLDAMGGDAGPAMVIGGAAIAIERRPDLRFVIFGEERAVRPGARRRIRACATTPTFHHCDVTVQMDDKPSQALRKGRWKSSMWRSVQAVRDGEAGAAVSAGNTGALMAMAQVLPEAAARHRAPGDRRDLADAEGREHRARRRRDDRRRRRACWSISR